MNFKISDLFLLFLVLVIALTGNRGIARAQEPKSAVRRTSAGLNGRWQVVIDWYGKGGSEIAENRQPATKNSFVEFAFTDRETLQVPGDWNSQRAELKYYEGTIWYKQNFNYARRDGVAALLHFAGVSNRCEVYLNGIKLGTHEGAFTPFQFDISQQVKTGTNLVVVKVNNERREDAIPARSFDWWNYGGITREVTVDEMSENHITGYALQLKKGSLRQIGGWVQLSVHQKQKIRLQIPEAGVDQALATDSSGKARINITAKLTLWSPENPKLYRVKLSTQLDEVNDEIGFRSLATHGRQIWLNGQPLFLRGISFHEEIPQRQGRAYLASDAATLLGWAKELGCNFVRLAHYPQSEQTVRLADRLGIMLWEEIPVWQGIAFNDPVIFSKATGMLQEMIGRDQNRCSVIIWSLSNETAPAAARNQMLTRLAAQARSLDSTRLISSAFDHFTYRQDTILVDDPLGQALDVLAVNKYLGWYASWPSTPGNVIWKSSYDKPMIISEFGAEARYGNHGAKDTASLWTEEYQEQVYRDNLSMFDRNTWLSGVCPWVLADFRSPYRMQLPYQEGWNRKGLLSDSGMKKKAWYVLHYFYERKRRQSLPKPQ